MSLTSCVVQCRGISSRLRREWYDPPQSPGTRRPLGALVKDTTNPTGQLSTRHPPYLYGSRA
jgi:hypothetical protein